MDLECKLFFIRIKNAFIQEFYNYHVRDVDTLIKRSI